MQNLSDTEFRSQLASALPRLKPYAIKITSNATLADDMLQSTAIRALEAHTLFDGRGMFAWLMVILRNQYFNHLRKEKVRVTEPLDDWQDTLIAVDDLDEFMRVRETEAALITLKPHHRRAILLYADGVPYDEIAARECIPLGTVKSRVNRAREHLSRALA